MKHVILALGLMSLAACSKTDASSSVDSAHSSGGKQTTVVHCSSTDTATGGSTNFTITADETQTGAVKQGNGSMTTQGGMAKFIMTSKYTCKSANLASKLAIFPRLWSCTQIPVLAGDTDLTTISIDRDSSAATLSYNADSTYPNGVTASLSCDQAGL